MFQQFLGSDSTKWEDFDAICESIIKLFIILKSLKVPF